MRYYENDQEAQEALEASQKPGTIKLSPTNGKYFISRPRAVQPRPDAVEEVTNEQIIKSIHHGGYPLEDYAKVKNSDATSYMGSSANDAWLNDQLNSLADRQAGEIPPTPKRKWWKLWLA